MGQYGRPNLALAGLLVGAVSQLLIGCDRDRVASI